LDKTYPKYKQLADKIREMIAQGLYKDGDKLETEYELVAKYDMSRQTVRQALSMLENEGLLMRRQGSGNYVTTKKSFTQPKDSVVGFISTYISEYVFPSIIRGAEKVLSNAGFSLNLSATGNRVDSERRILTALLSNPPSGLIVEGTKSAFPNPNIALYESLRSAGVKIVFINGYYPNLPNTVYVVTDDRQGGKMAVEYLIGKGHRRIGGIFKADDMQGHERYAGFSQAIVENDLELHDDKVYWFTTENRDHLLFEDGGKELVDKFSDCSAIVCYNDQIAVKLIDVLVRSGISVPGQVAVLSFDNSLYSDISSVKVTSFEHPKELLGKAAAEKLINMIRGQTEAPLVMPWTLQEKEST